MASLLKWTRNLIGRPPLPPLRFPSAGFEVIPESELLEEENYADFRPGDYCPVNVGDVYGSNTYQVVGKLGFGSTSTGWLARNLQNPGYFALKVFKRNYDDSCKKEFDTYQSIAKANPFLPGHRHVRTATSIFAIERNGQQHQCLVQQPMWDSWRDLLYRNPSGRFSAELLKGGLKHLLLALDYLHKEFKLVHTDIKADNILHAIADEGILDSFVKDEIKTPCPRKFINNNTSIYMSRRFGLPNDFGRIILSDFGEVVKGDVKRNHNAQPDVYRSLEVMLMAPWSYQIDVWNVGAMIWDVFEGGHLFHGLDPSPEKGYYTTRAHLAEIIALLGPPPLDLLQRGARSKEFFSEDGKWIADCPIPKDKSLEKAELFLTGKDKELFLTFIRGMLTWGPEDRKTPKELLEDPWMKDNLF